MAETSASRTSFGTLSAEPRRALLADPGYQAFAYAVGVIEIVAGIIVNLLTIPDCYDLAPRDFGLLLAASSRAAHASAVLPVPARLSRRRLGRTADVPDRGSSEEFG